jgi:hypothetical protein
VDGDQEIGRLVIVEGRFDHRLLPPNLLVEAIEIQVSEIVEALCEF